MKKNILMILFLVLFALIGCSEQKESEPNVSEIPKLVDKEQYKARNISADITDELTALDVIVSNCFVNQKEQYVFYYKTINEKNLQETLYQYSYDESVGWEKGNVPWWDKMKDELGRNYTLSFINYGMDMNLYAVFCNNTDGFVYKLYKINEETDEVKEVELSCLKKQEDVDSLLVYVGAFASGNVLIQKANGEIAWYDAVTGEQVGFYNEMSHKLFMGYDSFFVVDSLNTKIIRVSEERGEGTEIFSLQDEVLLNSDDAETSLHVEVFENQNEDIFVMVPTGIYKIDQKTKKSERLVSGFASKEIGSAEGGTMGLAEKDGTILLMRREAVEEGIKLYATEYVQGEVTE